MKKSVVITTICIIIGLIIWVTRPIDNKLYLRYPVQAQSFTHGKTVTHFVINEGNFKGSNNFFISTNLNFKSDVLPNDCYVADAKYSVSLLDEQSKGANFLLTEVATVSKDGLVFSLSGNNIKIGDFRIKSYWKFSSACKFEQKDYEVENEFIAKRTYLRRFESWFLVT